MHSPKPYPSAYGMEEKLLQQISEQLIPFGLLVLESNTILTAEARSWRSFIMCFLAFSQLSSSDTFFFFSLKPQIIFLSASEARSKTSPERKVCHNKISNPQSPGLNQDTLPIMLPSKTLKKSRGT